MYDYFVTISCNWADEMDVFGYSFMSSEDVKALKKKLKKKDDWFSVYIGSNQELEFDNGEECLECIEFMKIKNEEEFKILNRFLNGEYYCPITPEKILENLSENEYYENEDSEECYEDEDDF